MPQQFCGPDSDRVAQGQETVPEQLLARNAYTAVRRWLFSPNPCGYDD